MLLLLLPVMVTLCGGEAATSTSDMAELRGELEQLRAEVRRARDTDRYAAHRKYFCACQKIFLQVTISCVRFWIGLFVCVPCTIEIEV